MAFGRPTLYDPNYCIELYEHMKSGLSFESFAGIIGTGRAVLYNWLKEYPDFLDAKSAGAEASLLYWESKGRDGLEKDRFQSSLYIFTMKARFKWADQVVVKDDREEEIRKKLRDLPMSELTALTKANIEEEDPNAG